ncbi:MAG: TolB family protein [Planctomycetota bacterium]|jgi:Tol biopolymer transport system component
MTHVRLLTTVIAAIIGCVSVLAFAGNRPRTPVLASIANGGAASNGGAYDGAVSSNGRYVTFYSDATDLLPTPTADSQVFVRDLRKGTTTLVTRSTEGMVANGDSFSPAISKNGRLVTFSSRAGDLVAGDTNDFTDIFVADLRTGDIEIISRPMGGGEGNDHAYMWGRAMSDNGRLVVFASSASNLADGDTNGQRDVFLHDRVRGETTLVSRTPAGIPGNGASSEASISPNGRFVVFDSSATDLTDEPSAGQYGIFLYDVRRGTLEQVTRAVDGGAPDGGSFDPVVSNNGRWVAFWSRATNLVDDDDNDNYDVFLVDRRKGETRLISRTPAEEPGNGNSWGVVISANGKTILLYSTSTDLVTPDDNGSNNDLYQYDPRRGTLTRLGPAPDGAQGDGDAYFSPAGLSSNGRWLQFTSSSSNLVEGATVEVDGAYVIRVR